jgi:signal transduction histidine kinase/DNA-binding response OmpR family regulator
VEALITSILEGVFFVLFAVVLIRYLRHPTPLDRDVLAVFASVAGLFLLGILGRFFPDLALIRTSAAVVLMAQPYLTFRLIGHFTPLPGWLHVAVLVAFVAAAAWVVVGLQGNGRIGLLYVIGYFVVVNVVGAFGFLRAALSRVGSARTRLGLAGLATFLLGASVLIAGATSATAGGGTGPSAGTTAARVVALLAGFGYLLAFVPPRFVRRVQRQATAFELNQELLALPTGSNAAEMWGRLAAAARRVTGGRASVIIASGPEGLILAVDGEWDERPVVGHGLGRIEERRGTGPRVLRGVEEPLASIARAVRADTTILVPLKGATGRRGHLAVFIEGSALFVDDDLAVLTILGSRTIAGIEREEALEERSALVATLRRTNDELARASAAKSDFLAAMSHELRTPLNSIIGFSELLMSPVASTDGRRSLDVVDQAAHIHSAGLQLLDLINEVLDLARIEAGRLELRYDRFELTGLVRRTVDSMAPVADQRSVTIELDASEDVLVEADPGRVRQVVYNLLSNAIKFSPESGVVRVEVTVEGETASVRVRDEGPGIPAGEQAQVFEAFAQGQQGVLRSDGAGLGLALSQQLAEAHGGRIDLLSEPPRGSAFAIRIPTRRPAVATASATSAHHHVLVIEDDAGMVALLRSWLEPEGYTVSSAPNGKEGLDLARAVVPDAILLDIVLPDIDGWDVLQQLRLERRTRDVPILVVSVLEDQQLGLAFGAADYLVKPVERQILLDRLDRITRVRSAEPIIVLAIDPDGDAQGTYHAALDGTARIVEARSAATARAVAPDAGADVILLDLGLEDESPFELLASLRAHPATRATPVLAMTSRPLSDADKRRLTGQVAAVVQKRDVSRELASWLTTLPAPRWSERSATA